ncbi:hypothetical protein [Ancylobacter sp.]|uniref:hypothetical protein n=1 Tax=Ancylobacter sp. TaxID=1872567 RepID=UPI003C7CCE7A
MSDRRDKILHVSALDFIKCGCFGPIRIGSTLGEVRAFFKKLSGLEEEYLNLVSNDKSLEGLCVFVTGAIKIYLHKKYNDEFKVSSIFVEAVKKNTRFIDDERYIHFDCINLRRGNSISTIKRKLEELGIEIKEQKTVAYSVELHTNPYGVLVFEFYPPEGVFESTAKFVLFMVK